MIHRWELYDGFPFSERSSPELVVYQNKIFMIVPDVYNLIAVVCKFLSYCADSSNKSSPHNYKSYSTSSILVKQLSVVTVLPLLIRVFTSLIAKLVMWFIVLLAFVVLDWRPREISWLRGYAIIESQHQNIFSPSFPDLFGICCRKHRQPRVEINCLSTVGTSPET